MRKYFYRYVQPEKHMKWAKIWQTYGGKTGGEKSNFGENVKFYWIYIWFWCSIRCNQEERGLINWFGKEILEAEDFLLVG